jgi:hypothetical protein
MPSQDPNAMPNPMPDPDRMPSPTVPADHPEHDPLLVAAYAAGDATGAQLDAAAGLVATCEACAALHRDLRSIARALPVTAATAPVPRPRDFRLTAEQAAALHPSGWRRLLAPLAGPSFAFARPLGTGLATIGLAGMLVAGATGIPLGGGAAAGPQPASTAGGAEAFAPLTASEPSPAAAAQPPYEYDAASEAPAADDGGPAASAEAATPTESDARTDGGPVALGPAATAGPAGPAGSPVPVDDNGQAPGTGDESQGPDEIMTAAGTPVVGDEPGGGMMASAGEAPLVPPASPATWIAGLGLATLALGVLLVALRWTARRLA